MDGYPTGTWYPTASVSCRPKVGASHAKVASGIGNVGWVHRAGLGALLGGTRAVFCRCPVGVCAFVPDLFVCSWPVDVDVEGGVERGVVLPKPRRTPRGPLGGLRLRLCTAGILWPWAPFRQPGIELCGRVVFSCLRPWSALPRCCPHVRPARELLGRGAPHPERRVAPHGFTRVAARCACARGCAGPGHQGHHAAGHLWQAVPAVRISVSPCAAPHAVPTPWPQLWRRWVAMLWGWQPLTRYSPGDH